YILQTSAVPTLISDLFSSLGTRPTARPAAMTDVEKLISFSDKQVEEVMGKWDTESQVRDQVSEMKREAGIEKGQYVVKRPIIIPTDIKKPITKGGEVVYEAGEKTAVSPEYINALKEQIVQTLDERGLSEKYFKGLQKQILKESGQAEMDAAQMSAALSAIQDARPYKLQVGGLWEQVITKDTEFKLSSQMSILGATDFKDALKSINSYIEDNLIPTIVFVGLLVRALGKNIKSALTFKTAASSYTGLDEIVRRTEERLARLKGSRKRDVGDDGVVLDDGEATGNREARIKKENIALTERFAILDRLQVYGYTSLEILREKLRILDKDYPERLSEIAKLEEKLNSQRTKELVKYSKLLKTTFSEGIEGLLKGETGIKDFATTVADVFKDTLIKELSGLITKQIFKATGLGDIFSKQMFAIKHGFEYGANITQKAIVSGFNMGTGLSRGGGGGGITPTTFGGVGPLENRQIGTTPTGIPVYQTKSGQITSSKGISPGVIGSGVTGAMTGFSQFQQVQAAGGSMGQSIGSGILTGGGAAAMMGGMMNLGAGGALLGLGPVGWIALGIMAAIGGSLLGQTDEPETYREEIREQTVQISSRIDVSNSHLEWVNRNLVALRQELTYILPQSAYLSERGIADDFAIGVQRGGQ
ncbi:hypothetical protein LCGC14_1161040, partial [marine sediment metagenome]